MNYMESLFSAEFIHAFAWTLLHSLWQGGLLALMAAWMMLIFRRHSPGIRYAILYSLLMMLPVLFAGTFMMNYHPGHAGQSVIQNLTMLQPGNQAGEAVISADNDGPFPWYADPVRFFEHQAGWLVLVWFLGFVVFLLRFTGSILYIHRLKHSHIFEVDESWNNNLLNLSGRIGLYEPVRLAESALTKVPMTIGHLKPVILLPLGTLSGVPPQQIDAILLHELAHILKKDYLLNILQSVIELLFFYHPVAWWLSGMIRQEREHICDDLAIGVNHDQINYIKALTTMEELSSKSPLLAHSMTGSKKKLLFRVKRLLNPVRLRDGMGEGIIASVLLLGFVIALSLNALSFIPSKFDLTGREFGEKLINLLPFNPADQTKTIPQASISQTFVLPPAVAENADTTIARSKSGKVTIMVYTDSTSQAKQEDLDRIAESMDKQSQEMDKCMKEYQIQVGEMDAQKKKCKEQCKVIVIQRPDTTVSVGDSALQIFNYSYSMPDLDRYNGMITFNNDSIDSIFSIGPDGMLNLRLHEGTAWRNREMEEKMRHMERRMQEVNKDWMENPPEQYYGLMPKDEPPELGYTPFLDHPPAEKIIRQELRDDHLTQARKDYIIDIDSKGMYINGEKQPKEVYRKYRRLVESLDAGDIEGGGTYRLIF